MDKETNECTRQMANESIELKRSASSESCEITGNLFNEDNGQRLMTLPNSDCQDKYKKLLLELGKFTISKKSSRKKYTKEAKLLINQIHDVNFRDDSGKTPLHHAATLGNVELVRYLLDRNANAQVKDDESWTPLRICASRGNVECLKLILDKLKTLESKNMDDINQSLHEAAKKKSGTCMEELLKAGAKLDFNAVLKVSSCTRTLQNFFDSFVKFKNVDPSEHFFTLTFDYSALIPNCHQMEVVEHILNAKNEKRDELILHPLIESFIFFKWNKIRYIYYAYIVLYFVLNCVFTAFMVSSLVPHNSTKTEQQMEQEANSSSTDQFTKYLVSNVLLWISRGVVLVFIIVEVIQMIVGRWKYFRNFFRLSEILTLVYFGALLCFTPPLIEEGWGILHPLVFALHFRWISLTVICGIIGNTFGTYSIMFYVVTNHLAKLLMAFVFLFVGFASTFYVVFNNSPAVKDLGIFLWLFNMMINALDYEQFFYGENKAVTLPGTAHVIYGGFLMLICLVLLNLFIALAVNDTKNLEKKGRAYQLRIQAMAVSSLEQCLGMKTTLLLKLLGIDKVVLKLQRWMEIDIKIKVDGSRQVLKYREPTQHNQSSNQQYNGTDGQALLASSIRINEEQCIEKCNVRLPEDIFDRVFLRPCAE